MTSTGRAWAIVLLAEHAAIEPWITRCLSFDPASRPTALAVADAIAVLPGRAGRPLGPQAIHRRDQASGQSPTTLEPA